MLAEIVLPGSTPVRESADVSILETLSYGGDLVVAIRDARRRYLSRNIAQLRNGKDRLLRALNFPAQKDAKYLYNRAYSYK